MNSTNSNKTNKLNLELLSTDDQVVLGALKKSSEGGEINLLKSILEVGLTHKNDLVKQEAQHILNHLKVKGAETIFMQALRDTALIPHRKEILAFMWNSDIQPTDHLLEIVKLAMAGNQEEALECITLIESMDGPFAPLALTKSTGVLRAYLGSHEVSLKSKLLEEIAVLLERHTESDS